MHSRAWTGNALAQNQLKNLTTARLELYKRGWFVVERPALLQMEFPLDGFWSLKKLLTLTLWSQARWTLGFPLPLWLQHKVVRVVFANCEVKLTKVWPILRYSITQLCAWIEAIRSVRHHRWKNLGVPITSAATQVDQWGPVPPNTRPVLPCCLSVTWFMK